MKSAALICAAAAMLSTGLRAGSLSLFGSFGEVVTFTSGSPDTLTIPAPGLIDGGGPAPIFMPVSSFMWQFTSGSPITFNGNGSGTASFPTNPVVGFSVFGSDGSGLNGVLASSPTPTFTSTSGENGTILSFDIQVNQAPEGGPVFTYWVGALGETPTIGTLLNVQLEFSCGSDGSTQCVQSTDPTATITNAVLNTISAAPEPSTIVLLGFGLIGLLGIRGVTGRR